MNTDRSKAVDKQEQAKMRESVAFPWGKRVMDVMATKQMAFTESRVPDHIEPIFPVPLFEAPHDTLRTVSSSENIAEYLAKRKENYRMILKHAKDNAGRKRNAAAFRCYTAEELEFKSLQPKHTQASTASDLNLPPDYPRDEYGVRIGNYHDGVLFLRDGIRQCGGVIPLDRIETRVGATSELKENIGNVRQFLEIHRNTFEILQDQSRNKDQAQQYDVKVCDEPALKIDEAAMQMPPKIRCPDCDMEIEGLSLPRHQGSRTCTSVQLMRGSEGENRTPIMRLACIAHQILRTGTQGIDDGDIEDFARAIDEAGEVRRFRYASVRQFNYTIFRAIKIIRKKWTALRNVNHIMDIVSFHEEDRAFIYFFKYLGRNLTRLPIHWIDMGEYYDMCAGVTTDRKPFLPPPPRAADPEISSTNIYPGLLFADAALHDEDEVNSEVEIEFSDDEATQYEYAPMATMTQVMVASGNIDAANTMVCSLATQKSYIAGETQGSLAAHNVSERFSANQELNEIQEIKQRILSDSMMLKPPGEQKIPRKSEDSKAAGVTFFESNNEQNSLLDCRQGVSKRCIIFENE